MANYGYNPRLGFEPISATETHPQVLNADALAKRMSDIYQFIRTEMAEAQAHQEEYKNRHRNPAPAYKIGDSVWLLTKNISTERPSKKLDWKKIGPYKISKIISPYAYQLDLPATIRIHPVFHTSLLLPAATNPYKGQRIEPPPPVTVNNEEEYEVSAILDSKRIGKGIRYLIQWLGYNDPT